MSETFSYWPTLVQETVVGHKHCPLQYVCAQGGGPRNQMSAALSSRTACYVCFSFLLTLPFNIAAPSKDLSLSIHMGCLAAVSRLTGMARQLWYVRSTNN